MHNVIVFTLSEGNAVECMKRLNANGIINICAWLGVDKGQGVITYDYGKLNDIDVLKEKSVSCPSDIYDKVYTHMYRFLDMVFRNGYKPIYEYVNQFNLWLNFYYGLFTKNKIDLVIFGDIPHFGVDSIAKDLADAMGIKTILFQQAHENNRFFAFTDINDIGEYKILGNDDRLDINVEERYEKDLFYMKNIKVIPPGTEGNNDILCVLKGIPNKLQKSRGEIVYKLKKYSLGKIADKAYRSVSRLKYKHIEHKMVVNNPNFNEDFVYFALHLQPEMTTSALGGKFCDQILAIERLRAMLPSDYMIYVKENPRQSYYMRDELFYKRLKLLNNVCLVGRDVNTYDLIRKSKFVATITGTVGWEAISGGKCVLIFGLAWYRKLPGVFEYNPKIQTKDILNYKIDHYKLENAYKTLMSRSYKGLLECGWQNAIAEYSDEKNNEYLYNAFCNILNKLDL